MEAGASSILFITHNFYTKQFTMKQLLFFAVIISVIACNQNNTESQNNNAEISDSALDSARLGIEKAWADHRQMKK